MKTKSTMGSKVERNWGFAVAAVLFLGLILPANAVTNYITKLSPSYTATGGGGVFSAYVGPADYSYVSPGAISIFAGREAGIIKAGITAKTDGHFDDEGLFAFKPNITIESLAAGQLNYDVANETGANPVWMTIEVDTGVVGVRTDNTTYQFVPTNNPAGWHTVDAAAGLWQKWNNGDGDVTGNDPISLSAIAAAHPGCLVARAYLRLGMGDSYHGTGLGTIGWVSQVNLGDVTHKFVLIRVENLQPSWTAAGGGGVYSAYIGPPDYGYVSPGSVAVFDGRSAGIIKAGLEADPGDGQYWDEGLFGFKPDVSIEEFADMPLTFDVENETGANPVWMTIEVDTGVVGDRNDNTTYQFVPTSNPAGWHTVNAAAGLWQKWNDGQGDVTGNPLISLAQIAADNPGCNVVRAYLRLGMGDSYNGTGSGTIGWVDKATIAGVTYDFTMDQAITFGTITDQVTTNAIALGATANSGLAVSYNVSSPAVLNGTTLTFTGAGTVSIVASQNGKNYWLAAPAVSHSFTVTKTTTTIDLAGLAQTYNGTNLVITPTPGQTVAGLTITYDGSATAPTAAGSYTVIVTINDPIYQ
ncbi:MAG: MBG domain-containing protein, partial [Kiritimatiellaeota bacterium]|nr:MBG domain-containing protein [Kiritimatiellota bacterium]